jgi:anti-sigma-K factor RskA
VSDDLTRPIPPGDGGLTCDEVRDLAASFVLGALDADEMDAVRAHLATCADAHVEFAELGSVLPVLDASAPVVDPPAGLKGRIMAAAAADLAARGGPAALASAADAPVASAAPPAQAAPVVAFPSAAERDARATGRSRTSTGTWLLRIAAVLAIALLGGWNLLLQGQLGDARTYAANVAAVLDMAGRPGSLTAVLAAEGGNGPAGLAAVDSGGRVALAMRDLAPTTGSEVYETWVIGSDGVPVPLGSFAVGESGTAFFEGGGLPTQPGIVLALTKEPGPGATTPTLPIVSLGAATAAG